MTTKLAEWASELCQITEIRPSNSNGGKTFQGRCNLGMVGVDLEVIWEMSAETLSLELNIKAEGPGGTNDPTSGSTAWRLRQDLAASGLAASISPIRTVADPDARSGEAISVAAFLLVLAPVALEQLFEVIRDLFQRPGAPSVKIHVRDGERETEIEFDPKTLDSTSVAELTARLRGQF